MIGFPGSFEPGYDRFTTNCRAVRVYDRFMLITYESFGELFTGGLV